MNPSTMQQISSSTGDNNDGVGGVDLYQCSKCETMLGRHRFPKKIFRKLILDNNNNNNNNNNGSSSSSSRNSKDDDSTIISIKRAATTEQQLVCHQCRKQDTAKRCKQAPPRTMKYDSTQADSGVKRRPNNFGYCDYVDKLFSMDCFASDIAPLKVFRSAKDVSESMAAIQAITRHGNIKPLLRSSQTETETTQQSEQKQQRVLCLCIGDGCTPRTAVLISFLTKENELWDCVSIDPALSEDWVGTTTTAAAKGVRGLFGYKGTLKEFITDPNRPPAVHQQQQGHQQQPQWRHLVLVCVHSHARFIEEASIDNIRSLYSTIPSSSSSPLSESAGGGVHKNSNSNSLIPTTIVSLPCCPTFRHVRDIGQPPNFKYDDDCVFSACRSVEIWNFDNVDDHNECLKMTAAANRQLQKEVMAMTG